MSQNPSTPRGDPGPERRLAFFPRRLHTVRADAMLIDLSNGDRRSGVGRREGDARIDVPAAKR